LVLLPHDNEKAQVLLSQLVVGLVVHEGGANGHDIVEPVVERADSLFTKNWVLPEFADPTMSVKLDNAQIHVSQYINTQ